MSGITANMDGLISVSVSEEKIYIKMQIVTDFNIPKSL